MNKDINVAEILKTKEKGTKLYDIVRDIDVYLYNIVGENDEIHCSLEKDGCKILAYSYNGINICGMKNIHLYQKMFKDKQTF